MKKFEEPMFKLIKVANDDVISTSPEDIDNVKVPVGDITGENGDFVEDNLFV